MARIYLSPSTQESNQYSGGPTGYSDSEEYWMRNICGEAANLLTVAGHTVRVGGSASAGANAADSNAWKANWHVAVHSNAGGGHGTEAFAYVSPSGTKSPNGTKLAQKVYARVAPVSNLPDRGVKWSSGYIELKDTVAPATIIELLFHDNATEAQEMRNDWKQFARAVAQGVLDVVGGSIPAPPPPPPSPPPPPPPPPPPDFPVPQWRVTEQSIDDIHLKRSL